MSNRTIHHLCLALIAVTLAAALEIASPAPRASANPGPNLVVTITNNVGGSVTYPNSWLWTITITNTGDSTVTFYAPQVLAQIDLPTTGLSYSFDSFGSSGTGGTVYFSDPPNLTMSAYQDFAFLNPGGYRSVTLLVTPTTYGTFSVPRSGGACLADPNNVIAEDNEGDNTCSDSVTVYAPDLVVTKTDNVSGAVGFPNSWEWTLRITNNGNAPATFTNGQTVLIDEFPNTNASYSYVSSSWSGVTGSVSTTAPPNFAYTANGTMTISPGGYWEIKYNVTPSAPGTFTNPRSGGTCRADPNNVIAEGNESNNDCSVSVTSTQPDLTITKTNNVSGSVLYPNTWQWTIRVTNNGQADAVFADGQTIFTDNLPTGATYAFSGGGSGGETTGSNSSSGTGPDVSMTAVGTLTLPPGGWVESTYTATPSSPGVFGNPRAGGVCRADPNNVVNESAESNNDCSDSVTSTQPDLTITKTNNVSGLMVLGGSWQWMITITNSGNADAVFLDGQLIFTDNFPTDATYSFTSEGGTVIGIAYSTTGPDVSGWAVGTVTLPPGGWISVTYTATPSATGVFANPRSGGICSIDPDNLIAESNEGNNSCADEVIVTAPEVGLSATSLDFGNQLVGVASAPQTVTVTNTGDADLHIGTLGINSDFGLVSDNCSGATVTPTNSCTFDVVFQPLSLGPKAGQVTIPSDGLDAPHYVDLNGTGVAIPDGINLLLKPDFANALVFPTPWQAFGFTKPYTNVLDCNFYNVAPCSVLFIAGNRSAMQRVNRSGLAGDMYQFGMSSAAQNVPAGGKYLVEVSFYNNFNRLMGRSSLSFDIGTHGWQTLNGFATATGNYTKITFRFYYHNPSGRAWFDDAFLIVAP